MPSTLPRADLLAAMPLRRAPTLALAMNSQSPIARIQHSIWFGGKCALFFAPTFLVFLFATILMAQGNGTAPGIAHFSERLIRLPINMLGLSSNGAIAPAVLFWSLWVFGGAFLFALFFRGDQAGSDVDASWSKSIIVVVAIAGAVIVLIQGHRYERAVKKERADVLEFVRTNAEVRRAVGGEARVNIASSTQRKDGPNVYEVHVWYGESAILAVVETPARDHSVALEIACLKSIPGHHSNPFDRACGKD